MCIWTTQQIMIKRFYTRRLSCNAIFQGGDKLPLFLSSLKSFRWSYFISTKPPWNIVKVMVQGNIVFFSRLAGSSTQCECTVNPPIGWTLTERPIEDYCKILKILNSLNFHPLSEWWFFYYPAAAANLLLSFIVKNLVVWCILHVLQCG